MALVLLYSLFTMAIPSRRGREGGFTLIELLVSFAILMMLILLTGPPLAKFIQRSKLRGTVEQTTVTMRLARLRAIKLSGWTVVEAQATTPTQPGYVIAYDDLNQNRTKDAGEPTIGTVLLERGIVYTGASGLTAVGARRVAIFVENGGVIPQGDGAFQFQDAKGNEMEVRVTQSAKIEIRKKEGAVWVTSGEGGKAWTWK